MAHRLGTESVSVGVLPGLQVTDVPCTLWVAPWLLCSLPPAQHSCRSSALSTVRVEGGPLLYTEF